MRLYPTLIGLYLLTGCATHAADSSVVAPSPPSASTHAAHHHTAQHEATSANAEHEGHGQQAHGQHDMPMMQGGQGMSAMHEMECPMQVSGTAVSAQDVDGGAVLQFETTGDVAELQRRVAKMAANHEHMSCPKMAEGEAMPKARVSNEPTEKGARLVFTPEDASQLGALRTRVHAKVQRMNSSHCAMHGAEHDHSSAASTEG